PSHPWQKKLDGKRMMLVTPQMEIAMRTIARGTPVSERNETFGTMNGDEKPSARHLYGSLGNMAAFLSPPFRPALSFPFIRIKFTVGKSVSIIPDLSVPAVFSLLVSPQRYYPLCWFPKDLSSIDCSGMCAYFWVMDESDYLLCQANEWSVRFD